MSGLAHVVFWYVFHAIFQFDSIDNSAYSRNGDYRPTRLDAQLNTSIVVFTFQV